MEAAVVTQGSNPEVTKGTEIVAIDSQSYHHP
jgi:hypothetical protein